MLKKAGMIAGVAAGLMIVGSPAFADAPNDLVLHDKPPLVHEVYAFAPSDADGRFVRIEEVSCRWSPELEDAIAGRSRRPTRLRSR